MRRADKALSETLSREILDQGEYGVLSLVTPDGQPYGVPLNYVARGDCIYVHCAPDGLKLDGIRHHPRVSFCVVGQAEILPQRFSTAYRSVIVSGPAETVDGEEKIEALTALIAKYSPAYMEPGQAYITKDAGKTTVVRIRCQTVSGKGNRD